MPRRGRTGSLGAPISVSSAKKSFCGVRRVMLKVGTLKHKWSYEENHFGISDADHNGAVCFLAERGVVFTTGKSRIRWSGIGCRGANRAVGTSAVRGDEGRRAGLESYAADRIIQRPTVHARYTTEDRSYFRLSFDVSYGCTYVA
jgi:hypothetical protein